MATKDTAIIRRFPRVVIAGLPTLPERRVGINEAGLVGARTFAQAVENAHATSVKLADDKILSIREAVEALGELR